MDFVPEFFALLLKGIFVNLDTFIGNWFTAS